MNLQQVGRWRPISQNLPALASTGRKLHARGFSVVEWAYNTWHMRETKVSDEEKKRRRKAD